MKIHEYNEMMRYLTRPASPSMDQGPTDDVIPQEQKPKTFYGEDSVMPSFDGMEDPKALEDYRQIELADGGVVEREGFDNGTDPNKLTPLKRRELIKETILEELNKFEKNKIFPDEKYALSLDNISDIVKEKTGKSITPSIVSEESKKLPLKDRERFRYLFAGETPSNLPIEEQKLFAKNYNKKTISQLARQITGLPSENKITKAKRMQLFRHAAYQAQLGNISSQEVKRGVRPKGSVLSTEKGFKKYIKDAEYLMKLDPKIYENMPLSTLDYRLKKAIQFNNVAGAFGKGVPKMLKPSFEHFEGIVAGKITKNPDALKKVGITTRDFNWKLMGGRSKTSIYKNIKTELETAMASLKLNDPKTAKESLNTVNKLYDDVAKKLKTVDRKKLPKYNLTKNSIKEINLKPIELNTTKRLANQLDEYVRFVAAGPKNLVKQIKQPNLVKAVEMAQKGKDKSLKNLIKSRVPDVKNKKLFSKIPGITDLFEMAKSIPDDFKKAKYLSTGLKTLGVAAAPLVAYDLYSAFKEGKPLLEVLEQGFVGTDVIGGTKRLISLSPKGKEARAVVKKAEMDDQIAQDDTFLDTDLGMLPVESDLTLEEAEKKYKEEAQKISEQEALQNKQRGENRFNLFTTEEPKPIELNKGGLVAQYFGIVPNRGRVGLKLGTPKKLYDLGKKIIKNKEPENPDRRDFLKGAGALGLAITAFGTGALKLAKTLKTKTALETLAKPAAGQPEWFAPLVDKIITKGIYTKNLDKVDTYTFKEGDQTLKLIKEEPETFSNGYTYGGKIRIEVEAGGAFDQPFSMTYFPNDKYIRKGQEVPRPGFQVIESRPGYTAVGPGDFDLEDIEYVHSTSGKDTSLLELPKGETGILSDMEGLEKIATGKIKNPKLQKKRQEINEKLMRNPTEDRAKEYYDD